MSAPRKVAAVAGWFPASSPDGFLFVGPVMLPSIVQASHVMWGSEGSERVFDTVRELVDHCLAEHQIREYEPLRAELHCRDDFCPDVSDLAEHLLALLPKSW